MLKLLLLLALIANLATAAAPKREEAPPVNEELKFDPLGEFEKPKAVAFRIKYVVYDVQTGKYLRTEVGPIKTVIVEEWEKEHGPLKEIDWIEYQRSNYISLFIDHYEGYI